jgi:hypothetical protein
MLSKRKLTLARIVLHETQIFALPSIRILLVPYWSDASTLYATMDPVMGLLISHSSRVTIEKVANRHWLAFLDVTNVAL